MGAINILQKFFWITRYSAQTCEPSDLFIAFPSRAKDCRAWTEVPTKSGYRKEYPMVLKYLPDFEYSKSSRLRMILVLK